MILEDFDWLFPLKFHNTILSISGRQKKMETAKIFPFLTMIDPTEFYRYAGSHLEWNSLDNAVVLDVGCGMGHSSVGLLKVFPDIREVIAIDNKQKKIDAAKEKYNHEKIKYEVANIKERSSLEKWIGEMTTVVSVHCFNCINNQRLAFENLYALLGNGGNAAVIFTLNSTFFELLVRLQQTEKWGPYIKDATTVVPECHIKNYKESYYREMLQEVGFEIVQCKEEEQIYYFTSDAMCMDVLLIGIPYSASIPLERLAEFRLFAFGMFMEMTIRTTENQPCLQEKVLKVLVKRPLC